VCLVLAAVVCLLSYQRSKEATNVNRMGCCVCIARVLAVLATKQQSIQSEPSCVCCLSASNQPERKTIEGRFVTVLLASRGAPSCRTWPVPIDGVPLKVRHLKEAQTPAMILKQSSRLYGCNVWRKGRCHQQSSRRCWMSKRNVWRSGSRCDT